jgi:hypothetical protein
VVGTAARVDVKFQDGSSATAEVARIDVAVDLALLRVPKESLPFAALADVDLLHPGETLLAIGYALDLPGGPTVTRGVFSAHRTRAGVEYIQTDTSINHGNSGGALISLQGQVVGINAFRLTDDDGSPVQGLNFAISSTSVDRFLRGVQVGSSAASPPAPATAVPPIAPSDALGPEATIRTYYSLVSVRDFPGAYRLMATRITNETGQVGFAGWFANKHSLDVRSIRIDTLSATEAVIAVSVTSDDTIGEAEQIADYVDRWTVILEGGEWRLASLVTTLASGVSTSTAQDLRSAVLAYDHLEETAYAAMNGELVRPRATSNIVAQLNRVFAASKAKGDREVEKLERITFRGFREPAGGRAEVDAIEVWSSIHYDTQGRITRRESPHPLSMTMYFVHQGGTWLLDNTRFY